MRAIQLLGLFIAFGLTSGGYVHAANSCVECHGNAAGMAALGYPQFAVTAEEAERQTVMPASCTDCHRGDAQAAQKEAAHKGLLTVTAVGQKWNTITRSRMSAEALAHWPDLQPAGKNRAVQLVPKRMADNELRPDPAYRLILWHDRNPETLAFNPLIAAETCGICHAGLVNSFLKSSMGGAKGAHTQSQYVSWTGSTGPQSCGLWTGVLAGPAQDRFTDTNITTFNAHSTMPLTEKSAYALQRICNQCHTGCLDCHFSPGKKDAGDISKGVHTFLRKPSPLSCYGGGKSFSCHAGPLERRRGDGYLRGEFTQATPKGKEVLKDKPDVHLVNGIDCVDCHEPNKETGYHGDLSRTVRCGKCHEKTVASWKKGLHRKVDCAACHTALIGGYAFNFWTVTGEPGKETPLTRIQDYLVDAMAPVLVKNPSGTWIPVHVLPHISGNVKADEVKVSKRLLFRNRPDVTINRRYVSNDAYAITGVVTHLDDKDHDAMVWFNVDRIAHGTGKSRSCESCHASTAQKVTTGFGGGSYKDVEDGEYTIIADKRGLRIVDFKGPDGMPMPSGLEPLKDKWNLNGNFALPGMKDRRRYQKMKHDYEQGRFRH